MVMKDQQWWCVLMELCGSEEDDVSAVTRTALVSRNILLVGEHEEEHGISPDDHEWNVCFSPRLLPSVWCWCTSWSRLCLPPETQFNTFIFTFINFFSSHTSVTSQLTEFNGGSKLNCVVCWRWAFAHLLSCCNDVITPSDAKQEVSFWLSLTLQVQVGLTGSDFGLEDWRFVIRVPEKRSSCSKPSRFRPVCLRPVCRVHSPVWYSHSNLTIRRIQVQIQN